MGRRQGAGRKAALAALVAAAAVSCPSGAASAAAPFFWEDPSFEAQLGLPGMAAVAPQPRAGQPQEAVAHDAGRMRFREVVRGAPDQRASLRELRHRSRGLARRSLAERLGAEADASRERAGSVDAPPAFEPPMSYGDEGSFARFRAMAENVGAVRREAVQQGPFGGEARSAPVAHRAVGGGRFHSPAFAEVVSQLKEIVRDPTGEKAKARVAADGRHVLSSVTSGAPHAPPPMAKGPPGGLQGGPPIPLPSPILTPITREEAQKHDEAAPKQQPHHGAAAATHKPNFLLETAASAHLRARPQAESLVETAARSKQTESPEELVHRLAAGRATADEPVSLPGPRPAVASDRVLGNPYVRFD